MWAESTYLIKVPVGLLYGYPDNLILELLFSLSYGPDSELLDRKLQCLLRFDGLDLESVS